jgi:hypothetical protein
VNARKIVAMTMCQPRRIFAITALGLFAALLTGLVPLYAGPPDTGVKTRPKSATKTPYPARVSDNRRFLFDQFDKPFFYLGDTAWELFHRLNRDDADSYLRTRASQHFSVIQAVVLAEFAGLVEPNAQGHLPLKKNNPAHPVEAYFADVDWIVDRAEALGLCIGMLPTWGDKWNKKWGQGPEIFTPENARQYSEFLGRRYKDKPIVWILGGDRPVENDRHLAILRAMAEGLKAGDGGRHLITFHPSGGSGSADWLHDENWLDFNMCQTGHGFNHENYKRITADYNRNPVKPCLDAEPGYEDHPAEFNPRNGYLDDYEVRKFAYWAVFAGACGHTYGCHDIWQFLAPGRPPVTAARTPWRQALHLPGAEQMKFVRALIESRPMLSRLPDQALIAGDSGRGTDRIAATRGEDGSYAMVYSSSGRPFTIHLTRLSGRQIRAWWLDPRSGTIRQGAVFPRQGVQEFRPPTQGNGQDWVLVLDDASRAYPAPGPRPE